MGRLGIYLPPFAADYSGVCSALYDLNCLTVINDPGCCTAHYVFYDEPRWQDRSEKVFSTNLRNLDAILGNDDKLVDSVCRAIEDLGAELAAVVGTPVTSVTGMDANGIAAEVEARTGVVTLGFDTTGFNYYDKGIVATGKALIDRFAAEPGKRLDGFVNILGVTPLDFGEPILSISHPHVNCRLFEGASIESISRIAGAECNFAVSSSGLVLAKYLNKRFSTPYVHTFPVAASFLSRIPDVNSLLVIGDQIAANSIRVGLRCRGFDKNITVAGFFLWDAKIAENGDVPLESEGELIRLLKDRRFDAVAADPMLFRIPQFDGITQIKIVHPAVSGTAKANLWTTI